MTNFKDLSCSPLRLAAEEQFVRAREFLRGAGFDATTVCDFLGLEGIAELGAVRWDHVKFNDARSELAWCVRVLLRGIAAPASESRRVCGDGAFDAMLALGLLRPAKKDSHSVVCPVWVYPVSDFVMVSDRRDDPDGEAFTPAQDVVFPAIYGGTLRFLELLPRVNGGEALDLCGGSGIGALCLSRTSRAAASADVAERSAFFAEFNARLNGVAISSLCGDVYAPVRDRLFDVISAHPPFVPATGRHMIYRDGGETGEEVIRRTVEGLPAHLRAGGTCVILCVGRDVAGCGFEQRARDWLGGAAGEFDIVFGLEKVLSVDEVVGSLSRRGERLEVSPDELAGRMRALGTKQFVYGALFVRRLPAPAPPAPAPSRIHMTPAARAEDFERLLAWRSWKRQPAFREWLLSSRPRLSPRLELTVRHTVQEGALTPAEFLFTVTAGFQSALRLDGWVVPLVARLDGQRSVEEVFAAASKASELPDGFTLDAFADLARTMIDLGLLEAEFGGK